MKFNDFTDGTTLRTKTNTFESHNVFVTPACAQLWLETHFKNRNIQVTAMRGYRSDMIDGRWAFDGTPVCFDTEGHLFDGRNRLTALAGIVIPGFKIPFVVHTGLPPQAQDTKDTGARRTVGQKVQLRGISNGTNVAAAVRLMWKWQRGELFTRGTESSSITDAALVAWISDHTAEVQLACTQLTRIRRVGLRPAAATALLLHAGTNLHPEVRNMLTEMDTLENLPAGSPTAALAKRIARVRMSNDLSMTEIDHLAFLIQCWNSFVQGEPRTRYQRPADGWTVNNYPKMDI